MKNDLEWHAWVSIERESPHSLQRCHCELTSLAHCSNAHNSVSFRNSHAFMNRSWLSHNPVARKIIHYFVALFWIRCHLGCSFPEQGVHNGTLGGSTRSIPEYAQQLAGLLSHTRKWTHTWTLPNGPRYPSTTDLWQPVASRSARARLPHTQLYKRHAHVCAAFQRNSPTAGSYAALTFSSSLSETVK